ncbi:MAG TPA: DNA internalization-related competence protein ComEC/Rec2 [Candidatus Limnocylindrales bacterium]|nr:DNA internalization-related competence protein ComEC/Rec2 [Candidatus Limnocylindrales bacterium]
MLPVAVAFAAGLAAASWMPVAGRWLVLVAAAFLAGAVAWLLVRRERLAIGFLLAAVGTLGVLRGLPQPLPPEHVAAMALPPTVTVEGSLREEPVRWAPDRTRLILDVDAVVDGESRHKARGRVQVTIYGEAPPLGEGQRVSADLRLHRPRGFKNPGAFDQAAHLEREDIFLVGGGRADRLRPLTPDAPPWPARVKRGALATLRVHLPEGSATLLGGLLLGERVGLPRETDEAFRRAGVYHVLAVSGFNVALLASTVFVTLALLGVPRRGAAAVAAVVLIAFALVVGGQPSVLRATIMGLLLLAGVMLDRESELMNALAWAALLVLTWRPGDLWDPGFQLSFAATAGIIYLAPGAIARLAGWGCPRGVATALAVSAGAQCAVTPFMLAHFNQLSLIGVAANLAVVPLAGAATTLGLLGLLASLASDVLGSLLFNSLWLLLLLLRLAAWAASAVPWAMVYLPTPDAGAVLAWYGAVLVAPSLGARRSARVMFGGLLAVAIGLSAWPWLRPGDGRLRVVFLDVGQGDATLVEVPEGQRLLIDGGPGGPRRFDVGERVLLPFLWNRPAARLDVVSLSHSDPDHSGGLAAVLRRMRVGELWENGRWGAGSEETLRALVAARVPRRVPSAGTRLWLGSAVVTTLHPAGAIGTGATAGEPDDAEVSENDSSLVLRLDWRGVSFLFTGDIGRRVERRLVHRGAPLHTLVLKVAHHGSRFGTTTEFLEVARPTVAIVSAGARNPFRHPTPEALGRLAAAGARVYRTDRDGAIIVETDGQTIEVTRWATGTTERFALGVP